MSARHGLRARVAAGLACAATVLTLGACGSATPQNQAPATPSAAEFCRVLKEEQGTFTTATQRIRTVVEAGGGNPLDLAAAAKSVSDVLHVVEKLDAAAPPEIKPDVQAIRQAIQDVSSGSMDPTEVKARAAQAWRTIDGGGHVDTLRRFGTERCGVTLGG